MNIFTRWKEYRADRARISEQTKQAIAEAEAAAKDAKKEAARDRTKTISSQVEEFLGLKTTESYSWSEKTGNSDIYAADKAGNIYRIDIQKSGGFTIKKL